MPVDPAIRFKHWAAALGSASLLAGASLAAAAELCTPIRQSGDFAAKLQKVDKGFSRADDICYADGVRWSEPPKAAAISNWHNVSTISARPAQICRRNCRW